MNIARVEKTNEFKYKLLSTLSKVGGYFEKVGGERRAKQG
jgi:hypothetical protein